MSKHVGEWVLAAVAVAGCGHTREAGQPDAARGDAAADDASLDASLPANSCPGATDVANIAVIPQQHVNFPHLVRAGARAGMLWSGTTAKNWEIYFAWLDDQMHVVGTPTLVSPDDGAFSAFGRVAWNGSELGVVYIDSRDSTQYQSVYFTRLDSSGTPIPGSEQQLGLPGTLRTFPAIAWDPIDAQWGVSWQEDGTSVGNRIWFERFDAHGEPIAGSTLAFGDTHDGTVSANGAGPLQWTGDHWALAYVSTASGTIVISEIRANGDVHDIAIPESPVSAELDAAIGFDGTHYMVGWIAWQDSDYRMNVTLADAHGLVASTRTTLGHGGDAEPSIAWTGSQFAVAFRESPSIGQNQIWTARLDASGALLPGTQRALTCDAQLNGYPEVSPAPGGELDIVYAAQDPSGNSTIDTPEVNDLRVLRMPSATQQVRPEGRVERDRGATDARGASRARPAS